VSVALPTSGALRGEVHVYPLRVFYEDTDAAGMVYYANYLRFVERARTEMMRLMGVAHSDIAESRGVVFAVRRCIVDYLRPARLDDALEVHTRLIEVRRASLEVEQVVKRGETDLVRTELLIACLDRAGRPVRLPAEIRQPLTNLSQSRSHS
jgi:acyl-CoA thioester hydrolase